jgi:hypothetical protein
VSSTIVGSAATTHAVEADMQVASAAAMRPLPDKPCRMLVSRVEIAIFRAGH